VRTEQVRLVYANSRIALVTTPVAALMLAVVSWERTPTTALAVWLAWTLGVSAVRFALSRRFLALAVDAVDIAAWRRRFVLGALAAGIGWGGAGALLFPDVSVRWQMFLGLVIAGVAMASAPVLSPVPAAFHAFVVPTVLPITLRFLLQGQAIGFATGALGLVFLSGLVLSAWRMHRTLAEALALSFENRDLVADLSVQVAERARAQAELRAAHDELEQRVEERTAELRQAQAFLNAIIEHIPNTLSVRDAETGRFVLFNRAAERLFGLRQRDVIGRRDDEVFPPAEAEAFAAGDREALAGGHAVDIAAEHVQTPAHGLRTLHTQRVPIVDERGRPVYLMTLSEDVTERQRLEEQLRQAQKMEAIGRLAGGIAHDFNNLLTVILNGGEALLERIGPGDPLRADAERVLGAAERAASLTAQLLAFSRHQALAPKAFDLDRVIVRMTDMVRRIVGEENHLVIDTRAGLPRVKADPGQIEMVILNLLLNARDAMPRGGTITLSTRAGGADGAPESDWVTLSVSDTGEGMDTETIGQIFEPFFTTKGGGRGTGLGLATVYGIVTRSGGAVRVTSRPGVGTTFLVHLPASVDEGPAPIESDEAPEPSFRQGTVLLAEDEPLVRDVLASVLRRAGFTVMTAADGRDALRKSDAHEGVIDVLVTDVVMPELGGYELAERLCTMRPGLRVLYLSGYTDRTIPGPERPGVAFLQKPTSSRELVRAVRRLLAEGG
jgi:PAS domain S-box-containing protein